MAKQKSKAAPQAVQTREQAVEAIARIGTLTRLIEQYGSDADGKLAEIAKKLDADTAPLKDELKVLNADLQTFCEVNRDALTNGGKVKFHDFTTGRISWRHRPPKVRITGAEDVIAACHTLKLSHFVRSKEEINKEAMLAEPHTARTIAGVSIGREGEDFIVEVTELANSDTRAA